MEFKHIYDRALSHKSKIDNVLIDYKDNLNEIEKDEEDLKELSAMYKDLEFSSVYLEKIIKMESTKFIKKLQGLVTFALKTIFSDEDYSCEIRVTDNSRATIHLVYKDENGLVVDPDIREGVGNGIKTVIGFVLQLYFINYYGLEKIIFVDEGFSDVADVYIPFLMAFVEEMAEKQDFKVVLITHDERLKAYANVSYKIEDGVSKIVAGKGGGKQSGGSNTVGN